MAFIIKGFKKVMRDLKKDERRYVNASKAALVMMGVQMMREAVAQTPSSTGALRRSGFVRVIGGKNGPYARLGFSAKHAGPIHKGEAERNGQTVRFNLKNGTDHFFRKAVQRRLASYARDIAALTKIAYGNKLTPKDISNPYQGTKVLGPITQAQHLKREASKAKRASKGK